VPQVCKIVNLDLLDLVDHGRAELARLLADAVLAERQVGAEAASQ
jgi:hypothetical protein